MFGYIKPNSCSLTQTEQQLYKSIYCGLCHSLGKVCGHLSRLTLSYDFVLLALLQMLVGNETPNSQNCRCIRRPFKGCAVAKRSDTLDRVAALSVLLGYESIEDGIRDEKGLSLCKARLAKIPVGHFLKKAEKRFSLPTQTVKAHLRQLSELENQKCYSPDAAGEIFGSLLGEISLFGIDDDLMRYAVYEIMFHVGKWIYLVDAADDFEKDKKENKYNPFLPNGPDRQALSNSLDKELLCCEETLAKIPGGDPAIRNIIRNILFYGTESVKNEVLLQKMKGTAPKGESKYERSV